MFRLLNLIPFNSPLVLVFRNMRARWGRTALTLLGIIVGVAAMVAVQATNQSTLAAISSFFDEASGKSDLLVETAVSNETFPPDTINQIRRFPEVQTIAPGVIGVTIPADEAAQWTEQISIGGTAVPGTNFWLLGRDPTADADVHGYSASAGRLLTANEDGYNILLVADYAADKGLEVGEDLAILTPSQGIVSLRIVGLIPEDGLGITNNGIMGIATIATVQKLFDMGDGLGSLELVVDPAIANNSSALETLRGQIAERLGRDFAVKYPASRGETVAGTFSTYQQGLNFFSVVSLFVGSFLIYNTFAMTIVERTREIGMYRAIGMTRRQVIFLVLAEAISLGVIGSLIGAGAGLLMARSLTQTVSGFSGQAIDQVTTTPQALLQALSAGILVTILAAAMPALQAARISPIQALRVQGSSDEGRWRQTGLRFGPLTVLASLLIMYRVPLDSDVIFYVGSNAIFAMLLGATLCIPLITGPLERLIRPFILLIFGNEGRLGSSNIQRSQGRTTLTVAALMVGISMVIGIQGMTLSFETDMMEWVNTALGGDLFVQSPLNMRPDVEARLLALEGITAVTRSRYVPSRIFPPYDEDEFSAFVAIDPETYLDVRSMRIQEGPPAEEVMRQLAAGDTIWIGVDIANRFNLHVGDEVVLETRRGRRPFRIVAIVLDFGGGETTTVTGSWGDLRRYFGVTDVSVYAVRLAEGASLEEVTAVIENDLGRSQSLTVESKAEFEQKVRQLSAQAFSLFDVLGLIGLTVGGLGVINTMLMNVLERMRELGGLRSLGMTRRQIRRMILAEAATMGFIGGLFGVAFGTVLADVFLIGLRAIGGYVLTLQTPYAAMAVSFGISFVLAIGAALYPAWRAGQVNIIEAIKHE
ncbi:MAG: ABC transporter permease [Anaerolineales bacterium]|nr:ABC transporter permease [Anaerolineales bacterium]